MLGFIRGFIALFVLMTIFIYLVPGDNFKKYIRFFSEIILAIGFLYPVLSIVCDNDQFLQNIQYEEFMVNLSETSRSAERIEYVQNDYYIREYENAVAEDVKRIAQQYEFGVSDVEIHLTEQYTIERIRLAITNQSEPEIVIGKISIEEGETEDREGVYTELKQELAEYYQVDEARIEIQYWSNG